MARVTMDQLADVINSLADLEPDEIAEKVLQEIGPNSAKCGDASKCAVALYVAKALNLTDEYYIAVGSYSTEIGPTWEPGQPVLDENLYLRKWHGENIENFISNFDNGHYPELTELVTDLVPVDTAA